MGPDFERPRVPWLSGWSGGSLETSPPMRRRPRNGLMQAWWRNFNDPVLDQLVAEAQRVNPNVRIAGMRIMEARAQLGIAGSTLLSPGAAGNRPRARRRRAAFQRARQQRAWTANAGFSIGWEIDFWGKFRRSIESADAAYLAEHRASTTTSRC